MPERTVVKHKGKRYIVVHDAQGVLYIKYDNAVMGEVPLMLDRPLARQVLAKFKQEQQPHA
jgi:hypothetical protein